MLRPEIDEYFMALAKLVSLRSTCVRNRVGCVIVDSDNHILSTGYNGVASGMQHCIDQPCKGADQASGQGLELCEAIHAEMNAILQCHNKDRIEKIYCTHSPCVLCARVILNTSCKWFTFEKLYPHDEVFRMFDEQGIGWDHIDEVKIRIESMSCEPGQFGDIRSSVIYTA